MLNLNILKAAKPTAMPPATGPVVDMPDLPELVFGILEVVPTGSYFTVTPRVEDTDRDYLLLVDDLDDVEWKLRTAGWDTHEDYATGNDIKFVCARKGVHNLIIYQDVVGFTLFKAATRAQKLLNYTDKDDRVRLFRRICGEDVSPD